MLLTAIVREVRPSGLLVRDTSNGQDVFVRTAHARRYRPGDRIVVLFNGVMTNSLPPQAGWRRPFSAASPPVAALLRGLGLVSGPFFV